MAEAQGLVAGVKFLEKLGVYEVILPFLLVFTIVFAILEKTKVLGTEKSGDREYTKKNLNAIVAFVVGFLVIASTTLVRAINEIMANIVLLVILCISFLMLVGIFLGSSEINLKEYKGWMTFFMVVIFVVILLIFLNAMGWLEFIIGIFAISPSTDWAASAVLIILVIGFIVYITWEKDHNHKKEAK